MGTATTEREVPRLKQRYRAEMVPALMGEFSFGNIMQVPGVTKVVVNMGVGEAKTDSKLLDKAFEELTIIAGQRAEIRKATKCVIHSGLAGYWQGIK